MTAVINSSTAMNAITLSALHVKAISFYAACGIVIGGNLGSTSTGLIAHLGTTQ